MDLDVDDQPDWRPVSSASQHAEGAIVKGSTGQTWQVRDGIWVRIRKPRIVEDQEKPRC